MKIINHWWNKSKTLEDGRTFYVTDRQNKYFLNCCTTVSNLYVQYNPHENSDDILQSEVHTEAKKILNSQSNPEYKEQL
jgi:hypothetical protein